MRPALQQLIHSLLPKQAERQELAEYYEMLADYPRRGGKGLRSEILLTTAQTYGVKPDSPQWQQALWLAAGLELFQNWVLIHDDIEDDSEERRGKPALHRLHGLPLAINAGDGLHVYMWAAVHKAAVDGAMDEFLKMVHRTAEGQHLDLCWVEKNTWDLSEQDYLDMVSLKTAYYTVIYPLRLGALVAGMTPSDKFVEAGLALGTSFQIRDDVLNLEGDRTVYGKEIAGDLLEGKRTLIVLHWLSIAPPQEKHLFLQQMALSRSEKDPAAIDAIHRWLLDSGSVKYAQDFASKQAHFGLQLLERALTNVADIDAGKSLLQMMRQLATRNA